MDSPSELRLTIARLARRMRSERASNDISDGQLAVLFAVAAHGPHTLGELSTRERVTPPSMNRTVNLLETAGLLRREGSPDDGRKVLLTLTEAGRALVDETVRRRDAWFALRLAELSPEQRAILEAAAPILKGLAEK